MERKEAIELTIKLYKLTLLFPKKEPLRYRMRETADRILEEFIACNNSPKKDEFLIIEEIKKDLDIIDAYFEIVKWQNWLSYFDILSLKDQYVKMRDSLPQREVRLPLDLPEPKKIEKPVPVQEELGERKDLPSSKITARQGRIIEILKKKEMVQVWEINKILPDVSKRTLRRDFEQLLKQGLVKRMGEGNKTFYKLIRTEVGQSSL